LTALSIIHLTFICAHQSRFLCVTDGGWRRSVEYRRSALFEESNFRRTSYRQVQIIENHWER